MQRPLTAALLALSIAAAAQAHAANLLANPGFEDADMSPWAPFAGAATLTRTTAEAHDGSASVLVSARTQSYAGPSQDLTTSLVAGTRYLVSAWVKLAAQADTRLELYVKQTTGGSTRYIQLDSLPVDHQRWVKLFGLYDYAPSSAPSEVLVYVMGPAASLDFYVDDVEVTTSPVYVPTPWTPGDFVRRSGDSLVVGAGATPIRLLGTNFNAYDDEGENVDVVFNSHDYDQIDYQRVADLGMNVVRLNLWWKLFENESAPYTYKPEGWEWLERNIVWARAAGVRLILDMHAPQGGFQGPGYSGSFWSSPALQARLSATWMAVAARYKDEPWIAAYDVMNEPSPPGDAAWRDLAQELVDTIRAVDANHVVIVEQSFASDYGPFLVDDPNVLYEFHWYERWRYAAQLSYPLDYGDYGVAYPDADVTVPPWDDEPDALVTSASVPAGTSGWAWYTGTPLTISDPAVFAAVPVLWATSMSGKLWLDDFVVEELDGADTIVRTVSSVDIERRPAEVYSISEYAPFHSFTENWAGSAISGSGSWGSESTGHRGSGAISLRSASATYTAGAHKLLFAVKHGHRYRISGWMKADAMTGSGGLGMRLQRLAPWETFTPFTRTWLETTLLAEGMSFYQANAVPVNIGEFGLSPRNFSGDRGGAQWTTDMLDLFEQYGAGAQWFDWHSSNFGIYTNTFGFPEPAGANQPLIDLLAAKFGGPGIPNLIALAGRDRTVRVGQMVEVDGSATVGNVATWMWEQTAGNAVVLTAGATATVSFTAPAAPGAVELRLTVTGPAGTSTDTIVIDVIEPCPAVLEDSACIGAYGASLTVDERRPGSEKLKAQWKAFDQPTTRADFGDPVEGHSRYSLCLYADAMLAGEFFVDRAGLTCNGSACWRLAGLGWRYKDARASAAGIGQVTVKPGATGAGSAKVLGRNAAAKGMASLPVGVAVQLSAATEVAMQLRVDDARCASATLTYAKTTEPSRYSGGR
ncbi:MAG: cellulase family glycosylhydrolase [Deltaproteobacteria bacterium]|nr:cellulase family glycosylhydrolase [Deltaproteobacteria bacterium]